MPQDYLTKYDVAAEASDSILGHTKNFALATGVDFVTTLYNSTVGLVADNIRTDDVLKDVDQDALNFYRQHKEGVEAASFLAGIVAPGGAAIKLLNRAKAGMSSVGKGGLVSDIFSGKKATELQTDLRKIMEDGRYNTTEYHQTMRKIYASKAGENFIDAAIFEGITLGTLNAHPYMEDYMESPFSQFAFWGAMGGAIGSAVAAIGVKHAIRTSLGAVEKEAISTVFSRVDPIDLGATTAEKYQIYSNNVKNLDSIIGAEANPNQITREYTLNAIQDQRASRERTIKEAAPFLEGLKEAEQKEIRPLVEGILADVRFGNVNKIKLPSLAGLSKDPKGALKFDEETEVILKDDAGKNRVMFYRASTGELFDKHGAKNAALAVDLKGYKPNNNIPLAAPNSDFLLEAMSRLVPSAKIDSQYLDELATWERKKPQDLQYITIAPGDLARQNAAVRWLQKQSNEVRFNAKFFVKNEQASHREMEQFIEKGGAGVKATHIKDIDKMIYPYEYGLIERLNAKNTRSAATAADYLGSWKGGDTSTLRYMFDNYFRGTRLPDSLNLRKAQSDEIVREIWEMGKEVRKDFAQHADAEGYVYLYRGLRNDVKGHAPVEGYTVDYKTAKDFAGDDDKVYLFKVHTSNIIGKIGGRGHIGEKEIMAVSPHNEIVGKLPVMTGANVIVKIPSAGERSTMTGEELINFYHRNVEEAVRDMSGTGKSAEDKVMIEFAQKEKAFLDAAKASFKKLPISDNMKLAADEATDFDNLLKNATAVIQILEEFPQMAVGKLEGTATKLQKITDWLNDINKKAAASVIDISEEAAKVRGASFDEIAAKLNLTKEAAIAIGSGNSVSLIPNAFRYTDASKITTEYLNPKNKMLSISGNPYKTDMAPALANLDNRLGETAQRQIIDFFTEQGKSTFAKAIMNIYSPTADPSTRKTMAAGLQILKQEFGEINNQLIGSPTFQTVDNALRKIASGSFLTFVGKEWQNTVDKLLENHLSPVAVTFSNLKSDTQIIESAVLKNRLLSLKGWRDIRTEAETGYGYIVQREAREDGKIIEVPLREKDGSVFYIKQPEVIAAYESQRAMGQELLAMENLRRKIEGRRPLNDIGYYLPPPPLVGKAIAYVIDKSGLERTKMLFGNNEEELRSLIASYKSEIVANSPQYRIVVGHGEDLRDFNLIQQYQEGDSFVTFANSELRHGGSSASAVISPDARHINEMMEGWEYQLISGSRKFHRLYLDDVFQKLDFLSGVNQQFIEGQPIRGLAKQKSVDAAKTVQNVLLGKGNIQENTIWKTLDDGFSLGIQMASDTLSNTVRTFRGKEGSTEYFETLSKDLEKLGIKNPWESYDLYSQAARSQSSPQVSKRVISAGNGLMATLQLRLADASFALVNTMSLPILLNSAVMEGLPKTILPNGSSVTLPLRLMYDSMRMYFNPEGKALIKEWTEKGLITSPTRQYVDIVEKIKSPVTTKDAADQVISAMEGFQKSKAVQFLSKPADFTESFTREFAMLTGYLAAKHAYPGISNTGATIHASTVADRAIGNYYSAQRPTIFQGALGSMLGLYQTYLMSFAQSVYRNIENRQFGALAQTAGLQAALFGTASWPGYNLLSETIGKYLSNQNYDLTTGTYRAVGDTTAELILYGLPSWLGPAFYTRGDITPRVPSADNLAIVNTLTSSYNAMGRMVNGLATQPGVGGKLQSMLEALSLQSLNRPLARASEIGSGESITSKGQTVSTSTEVWTPMGVMSRLLAVRPLEEQVTRNALHLNSYYGAVDYENRQRIVGKLRTAIRAGDLPDQLLDDTARDYLLKGGSAKGWTDVMNQVMIRTESGTRVDMLRKLEPDSALRRMISDNF